MRRGRTARHAAFPSRSAADAASDWTEAMVRAEGMSNAAPGGHTQMDTLAWSSARVAPGPAESEAVRGRGGRRAWRRMGFPSRAAMAGASTSSGGYGRAVDARRVPAGAA
jgi:hypothetical protein